MGLKAFILKLSHISSFNLICSWRENKQTSSCKKLTINVCEIPLGQCRISIMPEINMEERNFFCKSIYIKNTEYLQIQIYFLT